MIKELGFNSVMLDTKASEDFRERYETVRFDGTPGGWYKLLV